jgi:hypothetical protein
MDRWHLPECMAFDLQSTHRVQLFPQDKYSYLWDRTTLIVQHGHHSTAIHTVALFVNSHNQTMKDWDAAAKRSNLQSPSRLGYKRLQPQFHFDT